MATGIRNYPNVSPVDGQFPDGNIKDNSGLNDGTPVNKLVYADMHQTLAKLLRLVDITANGYPESEYVGFQYIQAMVQLFGNQRKLYIIDGAISSTLTDAQYNPDVFVRSTAANGHVVSLQQPSGVYGGYVTIYNYSAFNVSVTSQLGEDVNGTAPPFTLPSLKAVQFKWNGVDDWEIITRYTLEPLDIEA